MAAGGTTTLTLLAGGHDGAILMRDDSTLTGLK